MIHYIDNRSYVVANLHAGVNDGSKNTKYTSNEISYNVDLNNSVRDYMLGVGVGYDLLQINRNKLYIQGTVGIGSSDREKDGIVTSPGGVYDIVKTFEEKSVRYALSVSFGYDFLLTEWVAVGVNYKGWQVGYEYTNSYNGKVSFIF